METKTKIFGHKGRVVPPPHYHTKFIVCFLYYVGLPEKYYSFTWMFSPILGIFTGPILGSRSDNCRSRFGRRRPFILFLVLGSMFGLTLLIFNEDLGTNSNIN